MTYNLRLTEEHLKHLYEFAKYYQQHGPIRKMRQSAKQLCKTIEKQAFMQPMVLFLMVYQ